MVTSKTGGNTNRVRDPLLAPHANILVGEQSAGKACGGLLDECPSALDMLIIGVCLPDA
jgi:hypothetical protein